MVSRRKRNLTFLIVALGVVVIVLSAMLLERPIRESWHISKLNSDDPGEKFRAAEKLAEMRSERAEARFIQLLRNGEVPEKILAAMALGEMRSVEAIPALLEVLRKRAPGKKGRQTTARSEFIYPTAKEAIVRIGKPAVPGLLELFRDPGWAVRLGASEVLGEIGTEAEESIPALTEALKDENQFVREAAAETLKKIRVSHRSRVKLSGFQS